MPGRVAAAAAVGVLMIHWRPTLPAYGSLESVFTKLAVYLLLWNLFTYGLVALILSLGRQGMDVLLLRAVVVGFIIGATFLGVMPLQLLPGLRGLLVVAVAGLIEAVRIGPILAGVAAVANLLWYRSFTSLGTQLRIFNRGS